MSKRATVWFIVGGILFLTGALIFTGVMSNLNWDFTKLSTTSYETNTYVIDDEYSNIKVKTDTAKIEFFPSEDGKTRVECRDQVNLNHIVNVKDGTLTIELKDTRLWYEHIGINFSSSYIKVYLPETEYGKLVIHSSTGDVDLLEGFKFESIDVSASTGNIVCRASAVEGIKIKTSTGYVNLKSASASSLDLSVTTGKVTVDNVKTEGDVKVNVSTGKAMLRNVTCENLTSNGNTGDLDLMNVIANRKFSIERSTGDIKFDRCDAGEIFAETDTGDVSGSLLSEKVFIVSTDTGNIDVPKTVNGGRCEITTDTGDVKISVK